MPRILLRPYWQTSDESTVRLYHGDVISVLKRMPSASVQCVVTSPPYFGLRDYGTDKSLEIGSEKTPDEYVMKMVAVFAEVRRVLRDDGTVWLNLGDTYNANVGTGFDLGGRYRGGKPDRQVEVARHQQARRGQSRLKPGNLVGIPWRVALVLQADGWILRQDIIWHKPSPMPESVRNRCTKAHEYIFLLVKRMGYFYDNDAVKETMARVPHVPQNKKLDTSRNDHNRMEKVWAIGGQRNKRSVWTVASESYAGAHFATFPRKLITPCILAGTSEHGACAKCGAPWQRVTEEKKLKRPRPNDYVKRTGAEGTGNVCANTVAGVDVKTVGWQPTCECNTEKVVPCTVIDPFVGSGTTCCVALVHGRHSIGIDLSAKYLENNAIPRIEGELLERPALAHLLSQK